MPVYESTVLIFMVISSMVIFDESAKYTWGRLSEIFCCIFLVCVGIFLISVKESIHQSRKRELDAKANGEDKTLNQTETIAYTNREIDLSVEELLTSENTGTAQVQTTIQISRHKEADYNARGGL